MAELDGCDGCGTSGVELTEFQEIDGERHYCPYCFVGLKLKDTTTRNLTAMFNVLEKRLKDHIDNKNC